MQRARIQALLPRRSAFMRREAGSRHQAQVVAANVDSVLIVSGLNQDLNLRRIERYLTLAWESGARPVLVLNKADLCEDLPAALAAVESIALGSEIVVLSALLHQGLDALSPWLKPGQTLALLGSSGVGKSTLLNALAGQALQSTQGIREDDAKGRHTTTHRELFLLPSGALLMDTPGMREMKLWHSQQGFETTFEDLLELAQGCRFRDCQHQHEADCEVLAALERGELDIGRLNSFRKQAREEAWLERKDNPVLQANSKQRWKKIHKAMRNQHKERY